jgi:hypothetical protein
LNRHFLRDKQGQDHFREKGYIVQRQNGQNFGHFLGAKSDGRLLLSHIYLLSLFLKTAFLPVSGGIYN